MNKDLIRTRFAKNLESYNQNAKIQKLMAKKLVQIANKKSYSKILEIGCGTGFLTDLINTNFNFEKYKAIDIVEECEPFISKINNSIEFLPTDIETYLSQDNETFDLIISNAALQWVNNFEEIINNLKTKLNNGGELVFSTFGKENFREIYFLLGVSLDYFSSQELEKMFDAKVEEEIHVMMFNSPKEVLKHLKSTGVIAIENKKWTKKDLIQFENGYNSLCATKPTLTYHPMYIQIKV
jgi:malonyl-ACP O-methyltransferase BioC